MGGRAGNVGQPAGPLNTQGQNQQTAPLQANQTTPAQTPAAATWPTPSPTQVSPITNYQPGTTPTTTQGMWGNPGQGNAGQAAGQAGGQWGSTMSALSTPEGFVPPGQGYGAPNTSTQYVPNTYPPSQLSGVTPFAIPFSNQYAGYTPMNSQPNLNLQMGGTTGYKGAGTMK